MWLKRRTLVDDTRVELDGDGSADDLAEEAGRVARVACAVCGCCCAHCEGGIVVAVGCGCARGLSRNGEFEWASG